MLKSFLIFNLLLGLVLVLWDWVIRSIGKREGEREKEKDEESMSQVAGSGGCLRVSDLSVRSCTAVCLTRITAVLLYVSLCMEPERKKERYS